MSNFRNIRRNQAEKTLVTGDTSVPLANFEAFKGEVKNSNGNKSLIVGGGVLKDSNIALDWLPAAAETYQVSADPRDYVLVDVPIVTVDIPNRNMQAFPFEEMSYFDPDYGKMIYNTFTGKACHIDHVNSDPLKAKGIIFDSSLEFVPEYNIWKIRILTGWDRTKDPKLVSQIVSGERPGFSMGALCGIFSCSICGTLDTNVRPCKCMNTALGGGKGSLFDSKTNKRVNPSSVAYGMNDQDLGLVYQICYSVNFWECSSVGDPADVFATLNGASKPIWFK